MTGESDNLPMGGTDTAHSLSLDEAANLEFYDPSEDNVEDEQEQQSEAETDEAETGQEADDTETADDDDTTEAEAEGAEDEAANPEPKDDVTVTVNGEQIALSDLKAGYMRQQDYSRKTQEVSSTRRDLEAMSARVTNTVNAIADFLIKQIPAAPDPQLAITNPSQFVQQKALHEAAAAQINVLLEQAGQVKEVESNITAEQRKELLASENAKLSERFPITATSEGRKKFFDTAASAARDLGYSDEEIGQAMDHRMFALAHYAALGMQAEKAREKARAKVQNAPPVAPQKARQKDSRHASRRNQEAMKRLARTGSIEDALAIDFD